MIIQGSYGHEKSWNLKMDFPDLEKSLILRIMAEIVEKSWNFIFGPTISCYLKTGSILLVIGQKDAPKRLGFQQFLVMENLNCSWKSHEKVINFISEFLCEPGNKKLR